LNLLQDVWVKTLLFSCIYVARTMICIKYLKPLTAAAYQGHHKKTQTQDCWVLSRETLTIPGDWWDFSGAGHRSARKVKARLIQYELTRPIIPHPSNQWLSTARQCQPGKSPKQTHCTNRYYCKHDLYVAYNNTDHWHNRVIVKRKLPHQHF